MMSERFTVIAYCDAEAYLMTDVPANRVSHFLDAANPPEEISQIMAKQIDNVLIEAKINNLQLQIEELKSKQTTVRIADTTDKKYMIPIANEHR